MKISKTLLVSIFAVGLTNAKSLQNFNGLQTVLSQTGMPDEAHLLGSVFGEIVEGVEHIVEESNKLFSDATETAERWIHDGREYTKHHDQIYELLTHPSFEQYQMRVTEPEGFCDSDVKQLSGYLDVTDGKHLFFWFFEARNSPENAPLVLWLNGGPGCSSTTGLLFELGPCRIANEGLNLTYNEESWTEVANVIFLDQPVNVGFSYSSDGSKISNTPDAALDVYAFLQLFLTRYANYANLPFHVAAESYGGTYGPNIASVIYKNNNAKPSGAVHINLDSLILANGQTNVLIQYPSVPDYACLGPFPIYDDPEGPECTSLRSKAKTCEGLIKTCYEYQNRFTCVPAAMYCNSQLYSPLQELGLNPYDVRRSCDMSKNNLCYDEMNWIETWMNLPATKKAIGADPGLQFQSCNSQILQDFFLQGDSMHDSAALLPELINDGVRLLVYAGNADYMCNFMGNERWILNMNTKFSEEFNAAPTIPWNTLLDGETVGTVRTAGDSETSAGNITYVAVHNAGHMVPFDQPKAASVRLDFPLATRHFTQVEYDKILEYQVTRADRPYMTYQVIICDCVDFTSLPCKDGDF